MEKSKAPGGGSTRIQLPRKSVAEKKRFTFLQVFSWVLMLSFLFYLVWALTR